MKLGIVLHRDDIVSFDELVKAGKAHLIRRKGLLCEVESDCYPDIKCRLGRSFVLPTSYSLYDKVLN